MNKTFMRFPGGKEKALTLSYDDGVEQDIHLIEILNKNGLKCTFNINSGYYAPEGKLYPAGTISRRMSHSMTVGLYKGSVHEVAVHAYSHPWLETLPSATIAQEIIEDRKNLEADYGKPIRGMAYPYGTFSDTVVDVLKSSGIAYSRTTVSTEKFNMPSDWLRLPATCHHNNPRLMELAEKFVAMKELTHPKMFYLWGHSYEFEANNNWNVIEEFAEYVGNRDDIWYATNIEIYDYVKAYERLEWSVDLSSVYNPSGVSVWVKVESHNNFKGIIEIHPNKILNLKN